MPRKFATAADRTQWEQTTLAYLGDLEASARDKQLYCQLSSDALIKAVDAELPKTAYRLFLFLCAIFPFSGHRYPMPTQAELALRLGVSRKAVNVAQGQIEDAGLWQFWIKRWDGQNLAATHSDSADLPVTPGNQNDARCHQKVTPLHQKVTPQPLEPSYTNGFERPLDLYRSDLDPFKKREREDVQNFGQPKSLAVPEPYHNGLAESNIESVDQLSQFDSEQPVAALPRDFEKLVRDWTVSDYRQLVGYRWDLFKRPDAGTFFAAFFQTVVDKTNKFPQRPADKYCAAEGWIKKQGPVLWARYIAAFDHAEQVQAAIAADPPAPPPTDQPACDESIADRRQRYLRTWSQLPNLRTGIRQSVANQPELMLAAVGDQLVDVQAEFDRCAQLAQLDRWRLVDRLRTLQADGLQQLVLQWVQQNDWGVCAEGQSLGIVDTEPEYSYAES